MTVGAAGLRLPALFGLVVFVFFGRSLGAQVQGELPAPSVVTSPGPLIELGPKLEPLPKVDDPRGWELFRHFCGNTLGRRELSVFLDGTLRFRVRDKSGDEVKLGELSSATLTRIYSQVRETIRGLGREDRIWLQNPGQRGFSGELQQVCGIDIRLPDEPIKSFRFSPMEITPLWLGQLRQLAEELSERAEPLTSNGLPQGYAPRFGDVLRRRDGILFRFVGLTSDGKAWMVEQIGQPVTTYYPASEIGTLFIALVESPQRLPLEPPGR